MSDAAPAVPANISIVTLGVSDLARATAFYLALGWQDATASQETVTFLIGTDVVLGLYPLDKLAEDVGVDVDVDAANAPAGFRGVTLAVNKPSEREVDAFVALAAEAGGRVVKQPQAVFWGGYSGYFADPDGHLWEVAYNPFFETDDAGRLTLEAAA